jgi:hypothetical protein
MSSVGGAKSRLGLTQEADLSRSIQGFLGAGVFALALLSGTRSAHAQSSAADQAAAEALFDDARKLLDSKKAADACPKLEASQKLDPAVGTLLYLADCYRQLGRTASAWATFREAAYAAKSANQPDREKTATEYADKLKPQLSYMALQVEAKGTEGLVIKRDGEVVSEPLWSTTIPLDPGDHKIEASAPGKEAWSKTVSVPKGPGTVKVTIPALADSKTPAAAPLPVAEMPADAPKEEEPAPKEEGEPATPEDKGSSGGGMLKTMGWVGIGVGGVSLVGSGIFSLLALSSDKSADDNCLPGDSKSCSAAGVDDAKSAKSKANVATILGGAGLALAATGVVLVIMAPSDEPGGSTASLQLVPEVGYESTGISLTGAW